MTTFQPKFMLPACVLVASVMFADSAESFAQVAGRGGQAMMNYGGPGRQFRRGFPQTQQRFYTPRRGRFPRTMTPVRPYADPYCSTGGVGNPPYIRQPRVVYPPVRRPIRRPVRPVVRQNNQTLPAQLQGVWFDAATEDPQATRFMYVLRANDYDMFEIDKATNQVLIGDDNQPVQLLREPLTFRNGVLTLSPGPNQEGPFLIGPTAGQSQAFTPMGGGAARIFTRRPMN